MDHYKRYRVRADTLYIECNLRTQDIFVYMVGKDQYGFTHQGRFGGYVDDVGRDIGAYWLAIDRSLIDNPKALTALGRILEGEEPMLTKDLALGLERLYLTQNGNLTRLGYYAYKHLRDSGLGRI